MDFKKALPILIVIIVFGALYLASSKVKTSNNNTVRDNSGNTVSIPNTNDEVTTNSSAGSLAPGGSYVDYSEETVAAAQAEGKRVVLFFHASWCPTCKALEQELLSSSIEALPSDVVIVKTDYDTQIELKQKYGVTYQHTLVQIDGQGNQVAKWSGGGVDTLVENLL